MKQTISHYRVEAELGRGGMGIVYRAVDTQLGRPVALKVLQVDARDAEHHRRFVQEARAASALNHPHIVTIYEIGEDAGTTFIAMELVDGTPLDTLLGAGPLPVTKGLDYAVQIAGALEAAHGGGIVHRDIKPANIVVTRDGRAKVLDFGLAKLVERSAQEVTITGMVTSPGVIVGTVAYMSPEQAQGHPVDARSDIFSFGGVLYEILTGRRAFAANSEMGMITAILRDEPPPLRTVRPDLPAELEGIVARALAKDPAARYQSVAAMRADLARVQAHLTRPPDAPWRRASIMIPTAVVLLAIAGYGTWQAVQERRLREARTEGLREIERLQNGERSLLAIRKANELERYIPEEIIRVRNAWNAFTLETQPAGALVELKNYSDLSADWFPIGQAPIRGVPMPWGYYRVRLSHPGYKTLEVTATPFGRTPVVLTAESDVRPGMVFVPGRSFGTGTLPAVRLPDYWLDQTEVTNAQYKKFVDAGGYGDPKYWKAPFVDGARTLPFADAMTRFRDATGRPGPATWDLGSFPDGQAEFPVAGISWFEAAAFAEFAGKSLPSVYHWFGAAGIDEPYSNILQFSNFDGKGAVKVAERHGLGTWGTYDMAGNVKEWTANAVAGSARRYILGGSYNEPNYRFVEQDAQDPWGRYPSYGVRLVMNLGPADHTMLPLERATPDPATVVPVSAQVFDTLKGLYTYDKDRPLNGRLDTVDDSSPYYTKQTVSFDSSYSNERVPAFLFLPKNGTPPYQTIILFPNAYARQTPSSAVLDLSTFEYIIRSGRALLYPVYQGTFERRANIPTSTRPLLRDMNVQWAKDFFRAIDYLETRKELDLSKLGYYSLSMGAFFGPIPVSLEPRIKVAVFAAGGFWYKSPPETQPANFMPHVKVPVLLVNGKDDFSVPLATQKRFYELLGTAPEHKRHVALEGGHVPQDIRGLFREVLDWYDKYLGPVGR